MAASRSSAHDGALTPLARSGIAPLGEGHVCQPPMVGRGCVGGLMVDGRQPASIHVALTHALRLDELSFPSPDAWHELANAILFFIRRNRMDQSLRFQDMLTLHPVFNRPSWRDCSYPRSGSRQDDVSVVFCAHMLKRWRRPSPFVPPGLSHRPYSRTLPDRLSRS